MIRTKWIFTICAVLAGTGIWASTSLFEIKLKSVPPAQSIPAKSTDISKPQKTILTRKFGEEEYYLKEVENGVSLYRRSVGSEGEGWWILDLPFDGQSIKDLWYDYSTNQIFLVEVISLSRSRFDESLEQIIRISLNTPQNQIEILQNKTLGIYTASDKILDYSSKQDALLLEGRGGEGCTSWGSIWTLTGTKRQIIQEIDSNCNDKEVIDFLGYDGKFLYFVVYEQLEPGIGNMENMLKETYKIDPRTKNKTAISANGFSGIFSHAELSSDKKSLIFVTNEDRHFTIDL